LTTARRGALGEHAHVHVTVVRDELVDGSAGTRLTGAMRGGVTILVAAGALAGCGPSMNISAEFPLSRLAAMPALAPTFVYGLEGDLTPRDDLGAEASRNLDASINYRLHAHGARAFTWEVIEKLPNAKDFVAWSAKSMRRIMAENLGKTSSSHSSVSDFKFEQDLGTWRQVLAADYLLIALFVNGYDTRERALSWTTNERAAQRALACVVDLSDGRIAWCRSTESSRHYAASRESAQEIVDLLLDKMLARSDRMAARK
jgi:hypothetical protein